MKPGSSNHIKPQQIEPQYLVPTETSQAVASTLGSSIEVLNNKKPTRHSKSKRPSWDALQDLSDEIGRTVVQMASDINDSVELVKRVGCDQPLEFNKIVEKTNQDFDTFLADYLKVKEKHKNKKGPIETDEDLAMSLRIFENYNQFQAFFHGVMHHSLIAFTEFALQAKDRILEEERKKTATTEKNDGTH